MYNCTKQTINNPKQLIEEYREHLLYDECILYINNIDPDTPVYGLTSIRGKAYAVYKFRGEDAWREAGEFIEYVRRKGLRARIDRDASEHDKVFVLVEIPVRVTVNVCWEDVDATMF